ncbi:MAG: AsmA family protein [Thiohalocapsa sp.]
MSRTIKTVITLLAVPLLVVSVLLVAAPSVIDGIGLSRSIESAIFDTTGRRLRIEGEPRLSLLPHPVVELGPLTLTAPAGSQPPIARAALLRIHIATLPLFAGRFDVKRATLESLQLDLSVDADGRGNWERQDGTSHVAGPRHDADRGENPGAESAAAHRWFPLAQAFSVRDGHIDLRYPDDADGWTWSLFALDAGPTTVGQNGQFDAEFAVEGDEPTLGGVLRLSATIEASLGAAPGLAPTLTPELVPVLARIGDLRLRGSDLSIGEGRGLALALDADLMHDVDSAVWRIPALALDSGALSVDAGLELRRFDASSELTVDFKVPGFDLRSWMQLHGYGPRRGAPSTLRCAAMQGRFVVKRDHLLLASAMLRVDDTNAAGSASLWLAQEPVGVAVLALDGLDLDPYLAAERKDVASTAVELAADCVLAPPGRIAPPPLPDLHHNANRMLRFEAGTVRVDGLRYGDVAIDAEGRGAVAAADLDVTEFYGGRLIGHVEYDARAAAAPRQTLRGQAASIDVAALLTDQQGVAPISGTVDINAELTGTGADAAAVKADLSGTVAVKVQNGRFDGLDLGPLVKAVGGNEADAVRATEFSTLTATAVGSGGVFLTEDITGRSPMLQVTGQGRFDVLSETLDLDLNASFVDPPDGRGPRGLGGIQVPVAVTGDWQRPTWRPDLGPALRDGARRLLDRNRDTLKQIEESTGIKGLEQGLRGLFGF